MVSHIAVISARAEIESNKKELSLSIERASFVINLRLFQVRDTHENAPERQIVDNKFVKRISFWFETEREFENTQKKVKIWANRKRKKEWREEKRLEANKR